MSFKKCIVVNFMSGSEPLYLIYNRIASAMEWNTWLQGDYMKIFFVQSDDHKVFMSDLMQDKTCRYNGFYMNTFQRYILTYHENMFLMHDTFHEEKDITILIKDVESTARRLGFK